MHCAWQSTTWDISWGVCSGVGAGVFWAVAHAIAAPNKRRKDLEIATMFKSVAERAGGG